MPPTEAFLSHSSQDRAAADQLAAVLRAHGVPVFYSPHNILGAQQWHDEIGAALARCDWFLLLLSPESITSMWVKHELMYALRKERYRDRIVPLLLQPCDMESLSWTLPGFQFVSFVDDFTDGCRALLRIWGIGLKS